MRSNRNVGLLLASLIAGHCALASLAQEQKPAPTLAELQQRLAAQISQPEYSAALCGVKVVSLDTGKTLFEYNPQKLFSPASNSKLYTVALALDRLGPDYRIKTSLYARTGPNQRGTLKGDVLVYGRGDPTFNARLNDGDILKALDPLAAALARAGVERITGDLVGDQTFFRGPEFGSGWMWDDLENSSGAEISALTINDNILPITVEPGEKVGLPARLAIASRPGYLTLSNWTETVEKGAKRNLQFYRPLNENLIYASGQIALEDAGYTENLPVHNPAMLFVTLFREALARHGIKVAGKLRTLNWLDRQVKPFDFGQMAELGSVESLPLRDIAREVLKPSQNLYADLLLAHVGESVRSVTNRTEETSEELGIRELNKFLAEASVKEGEVFLEEGSGLSRDNLTTPNATVALLQYITQRKYADPYISALPIAGVDGTLRNRMKGTPAAGNVRAKTGTLRWTSSLSGYVTTAAGERLVFSLMVNRFRSSPSGGSAREGLDAIAAMLAGFTGRSTE
ncbi:MAG TPA: D-alanyl-D-alanine carboxypeptidase/D-alanyl-D-alanine-endopeptidase [Candidatus Acidoferrum sp.]|nr:D-alanyl-D-alanine carboxypeptidase/D-alanyl-D-alanine-endopeptidase [Candidatus Acidoferrum sp.]